jgi:ubiquinone/menaquinone biosynthesis C-methylase UbiE
MNLNRQPKGDFQRVPKSECNQNNQSTYCDYNEAFIGYDQFRQPHGLENILKILRQSKVPLDEQIVLEGGFGTGAYLDNIRRHVQMIYGVEGSDEGYQQTLQKVNNTPNVRLQNGNILHLSFPDNSFHAYMVNQVLHHLDYRNHFQSVNEFLTEAGRVLKPGGQLIINTCSQEQLDPHSGSYWHFKSIFPAAYSIQKHYIPIQELEIRLESLGFNEINCTISPEKIFYQRYYEDPSIALKPEFRKGDSIYSFLSEVELEESNRRLRKSIEDGSVYEVIKRATTRAAEIGEGVIVSARKV